MSQEAAGRVVKQALNCSSSPIDLIYSKERFVSEFGTVLNGDTELSDTDIDILLLYLSRDSNAVVSDGKVVISCVC
jgi:charged multivesicular body protein 7